MADNAGRVIHEAEIDAALYRWCGDNDAKTIISQLEAERVPVGPIYNIEDMINDPHYQARGMFEQVEIDGKPLKIPAILPKLDSTPGKTDWSGPKLGSHNDEVLRGILGLSDDELETLKLATIVS